MPRYRSIHAKTVESQDVLQAPDWFARYFWVIMPTALDSEGRGYDHPGWIKGKLFPFNEDVKPSMIEKAMRYFAGRGMIKRYEVGGRRYFRQTNFKEYNRGTEKEAPSNIPPAPDEIQTDDEQTPDQLPSNSGVAPEEGETYSPLNANANAKVNANENADADAADDNDNHWISVVDLENKFVEMMGIEHPIERTKEVLAAWDEPIARMHTSGVEPQDIQLAIEELSEKNYRIATPKSIETAAQMCFTRRIAKQPKTPNYFGGEYAHLIQH